MCNVLEAKYIKVFSKSFGQIFPKENAYRPFFLKESFDMVSRALRPFLPTSSNFKCLGDLAPEVRGTFVGSVEMLWVFFFVFVFLPVGQSLNLVLQNSGKLAFFVFFSFPFPSMHVYFDG